VRIFKFGGASIKDAKSIINVAKILKSEGYTDVFLVISAMGKITNAFEEVINSYHTNSDQLGVKLTYIKEYHEAILIDLFETSHPIFNEINLLFLEISQFFIQNKKPNYDYIYDQIVGYGELLSTKIISVYLNQVGIPNDWKDARKLIITNSNYRNASVDWEDTCVNIKQSLSPKKLCITQGFIAGDTNNNTTSLGREGSDYSAAIFAYCLNAESLTIWKDVQGVLNADPRHFKKTQLLHQISYREALEMAFYGASVIHPKTIKPLENKNIPLFVRSFANPKESGTIITKGVAILPQIASYTIKDKQILLSISTKDFSFMIEDNISHIFKLFTENRITVNLIQNSAISFSVCIEDSYGQFNKLHQELVQHYDLDFKTDVSLLSIRHFSQKIIQDILSKNTVLLKQQTNTTVQFIIA